MKDLLVGIRAVIGEEKERERERERERLID